MKNYVILWTTVALCVGLVFSATAQQRSAYLGQPFFGARELVLGGMVSGSGTGSASFWNPATLPLTRGGMDIEFGRSHKFGLRNWYEDHVSVSLPQWGRLRAGGFYWRDGVDLIELSQGRQAGNAWSSSLAGISGGMKLTQNLAVGAAVAQASMVSYQDGETLQADSLLANVGAAMRIGNCQLGVMAKNITTQGEMQFAPDYSFGIAWIKEGKLRTQLELTSYLPPEGEQRVLALGGGIEVQFRPELTLRFGKVQNRDKDDEGLAFGLGLVINRWTMDYAFFNHSAGASHYLSTGLHF